MTVSLLSTICPVPPFPSYTEHSSGKDMTTETFSDFCAQQDARNTIELNVRKWTLMLCDALRQNYINYSIDSHEKSIYLADAVILFLRTISNPVLTH